jgi:hypothetical protein
MRVKISVEFDVLELVVLLLTISLDKDDLHSPENEDIVAMLDAAPKAVFERVGVKLGNGAAAAVLAAYPEPREH